jgi:hypothetical protein
MQCAALRAGTGGTGPGGLDQEDAAEEEVQHDCDGHDLDEEELEQVRVKVLRLLVLAYAPQEQRPLTAKYNGDHNNDIKKYAIIIQRVIIK